MVDEIDEMIEKKIASINGLDAILIHEKEKYPLWGGVKGKYFLLGFIGTLNELK